MTKPSALLTEILASRGLPRDYDPDTAGPALVERADREIVVGSTWLETARDLSSIVLRLGELSQGPGVLLRRFVDGRFTQMWFGVSVFRRAFTWISDPAPSVVAVIAPELDPAASDPVVETACNCDDSKRLAAELERTRTERGEFWRESLRLDAELQCARSTEIRLREGLGRERDELWHEIVELRQNRDKYRLSDDRHMAELVRARETIARLEGELGDWVRCPHCHDGGACLPGGCGVDGCQRCGKVCATCEGKVCVTVDRLRLLLSPAPIAAVEPRAIVVGSVWWRNNTSAGGPGKRTVLRYDASGKNPDCAVETDRTTWREDSFREAHTWVSDPEPPSTGGKS